jgi:hypothetical protein
MASSGEAGCGVGCPSWVRVIEQIHSQKDFYVPAASNYPAMSRIYRLAQEAKVFWFFSSEKNILP